MIILVWCGVVIDWLASAVGVAKTDSREVFFDSGELQKGEVSTTNKPMIVIDSDDLGPPRIVMSPSAMLSS